MDEHAAIRVTLGLPILRNLSAANFVLLPAGLPRARIARASFFRRRSIPLLAACFIPTTRPAGYQAHDIERARTRLRAANPPCWDEPAFKATFALIVTVPKTFLAVGNMPVVQ
jgi:Peptidase M1 N-terminal domain